jgi:putative hydrolase of the HAD superfamily
MSGNGRGRLAIQAIIFDYGNVLCTLDRPAVERAFAAHCALSPDEIGRRIWSEDIILPAETGKIEAREHYERVRKALDAQASWTFDDFQRDYMLCLLPNQDGAAALRGAAEAGLRTFVLSNTSFLHSRAIFLDETLATVPEIHALSYKVGFMKPDPRIWLWLLERAGLRAEQCLYIDDIEAYCAAARSLGMTAIRYDVGRDRLLPLLLAAL